MKWWRTSLALSPNAACHPLNHSSASEAPPTISEKCPFPHRNRSLFSKFIEFLNKNHLQSLHIATNVLSFWINRDFEKCADETFCTDSSLCDLGTPHSLTPGAPSPLPYANKTHGNGHLCGKSRPLDCVCNRRASGTLRLMVSTWWKGTTFVSLMSYCWGITKKKKGAH